jgi:peptidoglycan/LPS O-acetylase OafA/YrhL
MRSVYSLIQAIRGLAALAVVYFHTAHSPSAGAFGVDVFFVLSGCIMAMLMASQPTPGDFLRRRLIRIVPLYALMTSVAFTVSLTAPSLRSSGNLPSIVDYFKSLLFIPSQTISGTIVPVLGPGWSLNYEMMFYAICAAALFAGRRSAWIWTITLTTCLYLVSIFFAAENIPGKFYGNPIIFEFVAGIILWQVYQRIDYRAKNMAFLAVVPALLLVLGVLEFSSVNLPFSAGAWVRPIKLLLPATCLVAAGLLLEPAFIKLPMRIRSALVQMGDASYAIYLVHIFVIGAVTAVGQRIGLGPASAPLGCIISLLLSALAGVAVHRWVDVPIQRTLHLSFGKK